MSDSKARGPEFDTRFSHILTFLLPRFKEGIYQLLVKVCAPSTGYCLGSLGLPKNSVVKLIDCPGMTIIVYCKHKATKQQQQTIKFQQDALKKNVAARIHTRFFFCF